MTGDPRPNDTGNDTGNDSGYDTALVTGASGLIGRAIVRELAMRGVRVVGTYRTGEARAKAHADAVERATGTRVELVAADLTDADDLDTLPARVRAVLGGDPAVLVCAHGIAARGSVLAPAGGEDLWHLNVAATTRLAGVFAKRMVRRRGGRIVLVGSRAGSVGMPGQAAYAASKAALCAWAASAAAEIGRLGITVNVVAPGALDDGRDTDGTDADVDGTGGALAYDDAARAAVVEQIAVRRLGTARDVAAAVAFLAGPDAGYISGQTLLVDGGARW